MHTFTGHLKEPVIDFATGKTAAVIEVNEDFREAYEDLKAAEKLTVTLKRYRKGRSLDANAYYWVLVGKLAKAVKSSTAEVHNRLLALYGQPEIYGGKGVYLTIPETEAAEKKAREATDYHVAPTSQVRVGDDGITYRTYRLLRGSHGYDTSEMAHLIDGTLSECKDVGIPASELATPEEREKLEKVYGVRV